MKPRVLAHILTFRSGPGVARCVESILAQEGVELAVEVTDQSPEASAATSLDRFPGIRFFQNEQNLGFCGGHNGAAFRFLAGSYDYLFILNPDLRLDPRCAARLIEGLDDSRYLGIATPLLLRAHENLDPVLPEIVDAAGMRMTLALRHFDRCAGMPRAAVDERNTEVFGGTGAALLLSRACVQALLLDGGIFERDVEQIYPQLAQGREKRAPLFDEAFFAYREDADLAWRAGLVGWRTVLVPRAVGWHVRRVTPERRGELPDEINRWSVRNRFLLQINNLSLRSNLCAAIVGFGWRNFVVAVGVLARERSSIGAFRDLWRLRRRAWARRRALFSRVTRDALQTSGRWLWGE